MSSANCTPARLYLLQLSTTSVPVGEGLTMEMVLGCYLIQTTDCRNILIDTGIDPASRAAGTPPARNEMNVLSHLAALGLQPSEIGTVICTHFDVDHAGYHDVFPASEFIVQRSHYELARAGHTRFEAARSHWNHPALRYRLIDGDTDLLPGLTLIETSGHTTGHQSVLVRLPQTGPVLLAIDAVMMQRLFIPERKAWPNDENEEQLRASTQKLINIAKREQASLVVFGHDGLEWQSLRKEPEFYN